jgi:hypothetical protein
MVSRRFLVLIALVTTSVSFFLLGIFHARTEDAVERATYEAKLDALRAEVKSQLGQVQAAELIPAGTTGLGGTVAPRLLSPAQAARERMVAEIKEELQHEMGLLPVRLLRERRSSFAELYTADNHGETSYGTAGYLGGGYWLTFKHAVVVLTDDARGGPRKIVSIRVLHNGKEIPAKLIDAGDADVEVHSGDWAIIRTREVNLPPLNPNSRFGYEFATPIFRLGNDYSKGIILSTGYVGQRMANGLVTCLTDGHPGVSGGGVLDQRGDLVGIPIGRMQGDYRFSFILPIREEMFRKLPSAETSALPEGLTIATTQVVDAR